MGIGTVSGRTLFEALADAVIVIDEASGLILDVNPATAHTYGYAREDLLGQPAALLWAEGWRPLPPCSTGGKTG